MQVEYYKRRLLYVTAGLDRGLAASAIATAEVEAAVASLTSASSPVVLSWTSGDLPTCMHVVVMRLRSSIERGLNTRFSIC